MSRQYTWWTRGDDAWKAGDPPDCLLTQNGLHLLNLPPTECGFVNGLTVIGGLQVVESGDLVRIIDSDGREQEFLLGHGRTAIEPGDGRKCEFCGVAIGGDAVRCGCGRLYCQGIDFPTCPHCGQSFAADSAPPEALL